MTSIHTKCLNVIRALPLESGIDIPWKWMEDHKLTNGSLVLPIIDISEENIKQTAARVVFALMLLTPICQFIAACNFGLGSAHLIWCVCNMKNFRDKSIDRTEFERAFIRLSTAVYDFAIFYLLSSHFIGSGYLKGFLLVSIALAPQQILQLHHAVFAKAETASEEAPAEKVADPYHLNEECLIQVFAKGMTDTIIPPEIKKGFWSRIISLPTGLGSYTMNTYRGTLGRIFSPK